ncbi:MAG: hypothetical protein K2O82_02020, partial [Alistipes sp.]|nr:hypothetical protein [Alistipes sp.]
LDVRNWDEDATHTTFGASSGFAEAIRTMFLNRPPQSRIFSLRKIICAEILLPLHHKTNFR